MGLINIQYSFSILRFYTIGSSKIKYLVTESSGNGGSCDKCSVLGQSRSHINLVNILS